MPKKQPPGPQTWSPLGLSMALQRDPLGFIEQMAREYGGFVAVPSVLYLKSYLLTDPDLIHQVLVKQPEHFIKPALIKRVFEASFGNGLLFSEGETWRQQHRLVQPAFHHKRIEGYATNMVTLAQQMLSTWQAGQVRNVDADMHDLTLEIVVDAVFHASIGVEAKKIRAAMNELAAAMSAQVLDPRQIFLPDWVPTPANRQKKRSSKILDAVIYNLIDQRRHDLTDTGDLLSMLLLAQDESGSGQMTSRQIHNEVMTIFVAGHETTALTLAWALVQISCHPEVEAKFHAELDAVLGNRPPTLADLVHLAYTEMIIKEVLRLYPPAWIIPREAIVTTEIGGYIIPKGGIVFIAPYLVHRNPQYYHQPLTFYPDRFAPDEDGKTLEKQLPRFAYLPFGGGPRVCIGNAFALMEARLVLAAIGQRYRLRLPSGHQVKPNPRGRGTLGFYGSVPMRLEAR